MPFRGSDKQRDPRASQDAGHSAREFGEKGMGEIGNDKTHHMGTTGHKRPRREIRAIIEFFRSTQDAQAGFGTNIGAIAEGLRNSDDRKSEVSSNIFHSDSHVR